MELVIAEKPSVAGEMAKALGGFTRHPGYFERPGTVITHARGHLISLEGPPDRDPGWELHKLPFLPQPFVVTPTKGRGDEAILATIERLARRSDITKLVNACDAGREGELIFRLIVMYLGVRKPIERIWMQSMTPTGIRHAFQNRRTDAQMRPIADAARSRSEADWLVGINATRALTLCGIVPVERGQVVSAGRVQTPTLALVVEREEQISRFKQQDFFEVVATLSVNDGSWQAKLLRPDSNPPGATRFDAREQARQEALRAEGKHPDKVTDDTQRTKRHAPLPFDLTTLQRVANVRFGFPAAKTLEIAQALYDRHKVTTYPRTDSSHLPSDYPPKVAAILKGLPARFQAFAQEIDSGGWIKPTHPVFNDAKISDHFAIIPTGIAPSGLTEAEEQIYNLIVRRFLAAFYPPAEFDRTTRDAWIGAQQFRATGKVLQVPGWLKVYDADAEEERPRKKSSSSDDDDTTKLPRIAAGERALTQKLEIKTGRTKPPPRYTEATLLAAMETAGKLLDDDALAAAMRERGLGTPATRAAVIEDLLKPHKGYLQRKGRELWPTAKAMELIAALRRFDLAFLASPELTGEWEHKLALMEQGKLSRDEYMGAIRDVVTRMVERVRAHAKPN